MSFDPGALNLKDMAKQIEDAGYGEVAASIEIPVTGMTCDNCATNIEGTLNKKVPRILSASVNFAPERAQVKYIPDVVRVEDSISAIEAAGYGAIRPHDTSDMEDAEPAVMAGNIRSLRLENVNPRNFHSILT